MKNSLGYKANIVIINGGTNNANAPGEPDLEYIHDEMEGILTDIWDYPDSADTCIILSTLLPTTNPNGKVNRIPINEEYRKLVREYEDEKCIYLADMEPEGEGKDFLSVDEPIYADPVHPNVRFATNMVALVSRLAIADVVHYRTRGTSEWLTCFMRQFTGP